MGCGRVELLLQFILVAVEVHGAWLANAGSYLSSLFSFEQSHLRVGLTQAAPCLPEVSLLHGGAVISV